MWYAEDLQSLAGLQERHILIRIDILVKSEVGERCSLWHLIEFVHCILKLVDIIADFQNSHPTLGSGYHHDCVIVHIWRNESGDVSNARHFRLICCTYFRTSI